MEGQGDVDGTYMLNARLVVSFVNSLSQSSFLLSPTAELEEVCLDSCVYAKIGDEPGREYCFKGTDLPGSVECSVRLFSF